MNKFIRYFGIVLIAAILTAAAFLVLGKIAQTPPLKTQTPVNTEVTFETEYTYDNFERPMEPDTKNRHPVHMEKPELPTSERPPAPYTKRVPDPGKQIVNREIICVVPCNSIEDYSQQPPKAIYRHTPVIPATAEKSGSCTFSLKINGQGRTEAVEILDCTDPIFNEPSRRALLKWRFGSNIVNGEPTSFDFGPSKMTYRLLDEDGNLIPE